jgi:uncharacterized protein
MSLRFDKLEPMAIVRARRIDAPSQLSKPERTPEGYLRCEGVLTTTGIFRYTNPDGTERHELRLPEEVFQPDSIKSFHLVPLTDNHPDCGWLDSTNAKEHSRGAVDMPAKHGEEALKAKMLITDEALIKKILSRDKVQISNGYFADLEMRSGEYNGERFDAVQRNIRGNHVAIVDEARAGPEARIKLDAADAIAMPTDFVVPSQRSPAGHEDCIVKIRIDGVDFDVPEQTAQAFERRIKKQDEKLEESRSQIEQLTAESGKLAGERDALKTQCAKLDGALKAASDPKRVREAIRARVALETKAGAILGAAVKLDELTDREVKVAVVSKLSAGFKADGKSEDYVSARFDAACELGEREGGIEAVRQTLHDDADHAVEPVSHSAEQKFYEDSQNAWKRPLTAGKRNGAVQVK